LQLVFPSNNTVNQLRYFYPNFWITVKLLPHQLNYQLLTNGPIIFSFELHSPSFEQSFANRIAFFKL